MTANQHRTINQVNAQLEAQRFTASQAARDVAELDAVAVLIAVEVKLAEGRIEEAKAMVAQYRASKGSK